MRLCAFKLPNGEPSAAMLLRQALVQCMQRRTEHFARNKQHVCKRLRELGATNGSMYCCVDYHGPADRLFEFLVRPHAKCR